MARNLWGWGEESAAVDVEEVRPRVEGLFGRAELRHPERPRVPAPRIAIPAELAGFSSSDPLVRAARAMGKSYVDRVRGFWGDFSSAPDLVSRPRSEDELVRVLEVAEREQLAVVPYGGGTSVVGGVEPRPRADQRGAVSVDVGGLDQLLELDDVSRLARLGAGILGPALEGKLGDRGFTLRHFPQSFEFSSLGGWIATRAGGHFATVLTHIDDLLAAVRMVTPRGVFETRCVPATGAGPEPKAWVLGSEGTLGIVTEAWVRIRPRPVHRASASVHFDDFWRAVDATRAIAQSGLSPANCRLLDAQEALINGVTGDGSAVLVLGFESAEVPQGPWIEAALALARAHGGGCPEGVSLRDEAGSRRGADAGEAWRSSFLRGPYLQDALIRLGMVADTFETACTWKAFPALHAAVTAAVGHALERICGGGLLTCRLTHVYPDGPAPYFTFLGPARPGAELEQWQELKREASEAVVRSGGTITHHHAVGRVHRPWYERERSPAFAAALAAAKHTLDPASVLNPGVLLAS
jgi:alkyldihydroxyacetonephosphate synthase